MGLGRSVAFGGIVVVLCQITQGQAWWFFSTSGRQEAEAPISEDCVRKGERGDCHFYTCFDQRHPCSGYNYALHYGWRFCTQFDQHYSQLNAQGKRWVNETRVCAMEQLSQFYRDDFINCEDVEAEMIEAQGVCEASKGVCTSSLIRDNAEVFRDIYAVNERSARRFIQALKHCSLTKAREVVSWLGDRYSTFIPDIRDFFRGLGDSISDFIGDLIPDRK